MRKTMMTVLIIAFAALFSSNSIAGERKSQRFSPGSGGVAGESDFVVEPSHHYSISPSVPRHYDRYRPIYPRYIDTPPRFTKPHKKHKPRCKVVKKSFYRHGKHITMTKRICKDHRKYSGNKHRRRHEDDSPPWHHGEQRIRYGSY